MANNMEGKSFQAAVVADCLIDESSVRNFPAVLWILKFFEGYFCIEHLLIGFYIFCVNINILVRKHISCAWSSEIDFPLPRSLWNRNGIQVRRRKSLKSTKSQLHLVTSMIFPLFAATVLLTSGASMITLTSLHFIFLKHFEKKTFKNFSWVKVK